MLTRTRDQVIVMWGIGLALSITSIFVPSSVQSALILFGLLVMTSFLLIMTRRQCRLLASSLGRSLEQMQTAVDSNSRLLEQSKALLSELLRLRSSDETRIRHLAQMVKAQKGSLEGIEKLSAILHEQGVMNEGRVRQIGQLVKSHVVRLEEITAKLFSVGMDSSPDEGPASGIFEASGEHNEIKRMNVQAEIMAQLMEDTYDIRKQISLLEARLQDSLLRSIDRGKDSR